MLLDAATEERVKGFPSPFPFPSFFFDECCFLEMTSCVEAFTLSHSMSCLQAFAQERVIYKP